MNWTHIITVYLKELKDSLRDRRTLISMIVIPTVVMPLLMLLMIYTARKADQKTHAESSSIMIFGGQDSPAVVNGLKMLRDDERNISVFRVVPESDDFKKLISEKKIRAAVRLPDGLEASLGGNQTMAVTIYNYEGEQSSELAVRRVKDFFNKLSEKTVASRLAEHELPASLTKPLALKQENVAPPEKVGGNRVGGLIPYIIIILCFTGAMYPAIDLTAGEKERGTMETLLCSPVHRVNIVLGKLLMVLTASICTIALTLVSMTVSTVIGGSILSGGRKVLAAKASGAGGFVPVIDPAGILGVFAMIAPIALFFAAVLLTIALAAKSYKEAQSYVSPLIIVILMPAMMGMMPGVELTAKTALIPILNVCLACKEMLSGVWHWNYLALIFASTGLYAAVAVTLCVKMFNRESVMFRA